MSLADIRLLARWSEQLRVLTDYQPIAAQVYERLQGLRREAYDSSDYAEGPNASSKNASHPSEASDPTKPTARSARRATTLRSDRD